MVAAGTGSSDICLVTGGDGSGTCLVWLVGGGACYCRYSAGRGGGNLLTVDCLILLFLLGAVITANWN